MAVIRRIDGAKITLIEVKCPCHSAVVFFILLELLEKDAILNLADQLMVEAAQCRNIVANVVSTVSSYRDIHALGRFPLCHTKHLHVFAESRLGRLKLSTEA